MGSRSFDDDESHTPMMKQWAGIKRVHPNALLLFRMGDFYEMFFEDAHRVSKLLDVTLTYRGEWNGQKIPMAGVPFHAIEQYLARLVRLGVACVIAEQGLTPQDPDEKILRRQVTRIITPGTVTESEWIGEKDESVVGALVPTEAGWSVGWLNLSSGAFKVWSGEADVASAMARVQAVEYIYPENVMDEVLLSNTRCRGVNPMWCTTDEGARMLAMSFEGATPAAIGMHPGHGALAAVGALLHYVRSTQTTIPGHLSWPSLEQPERFLSMDVSSRRNLELVEGLQGGVAKTLWGVLDDCSTASGSRLLKRWICFPENSQIEARHRLDAVDALMTCPDTSWLDALQWCGDMERVVARIGLQTAKPKDLASLRSTLSVLGTLTTGLQLYGDKVMRLESIGRTLAAPPAILAMLESALAESPRTFLRDGGVIATGFDAELDECRALTDNADGVLSAMAAKEREATGISTLKIEYNRNSGYCIEVSKGQLDKVPPHYQRKQSLKNAERYTIAELRDFENKVLTAVDRGLKREKVLYEQLLKDLQRHVVWLVSMGQALSQLDVLACFARQSAAWNYTRPVFVDQPTLQVKAGRHPVVERHTKKYQDNDVVLGAEQRTYVITGPNMGGKSTLMRQTALIALMAYMGCRVPAAEFTVGPMDAICTRIGASDDVASGRSTFMVEMEEAANILTKATPRTLAVLDEIGRGTSSLEGAALAQAVLEHLHTHSQCMTLFATHYRELALGLQGTKGMRFVHALTDEEPGRVIFTHAMGEGIADSSYGIHVAMMAGVPDGVIARAHAIVQSGETEESTARPVVAPPPPSVVEEDSPWLALRTLNLEDYSPKQLWAYIETLQLQGKP